MGRAHVGPIDMAQRHGPILVEGVQRGQLKTDADCDSPNVKHTRLKLCSSERMAHRLQLAMTIGRTCHHAPRLRRIVFIREPAFCLRLDIKRVGLRANVRALCRASI